MADVNEYFSIDLSNDGGMSEDDDSEAVADDGNNENSNPDRCKLIPDLTADEIRELVFCSEKDAVEFYQHYAHFKGFGARKDDVRRDRKGNIISRQLVCNREGERHEKHLNKVSRVKEAKPITRVACPAKFRVRFHADSSKWKVVLFEPEHNHVLTPASHVHLMPSFRGLTDGDKAQVDSLKLYGVRSCNIMGFLMGQKGGHESRKGEKDPMFFFKFTRSGEENLENLFWCDGTSRLDYQAFGDVIVFYSTYKKNKYNKPVVIFSGYNHHKETTIFACALVCDETIETYKWVLKALDEAMFGKQPKAVVTDGDKSMREAVKVVFPNATHRLCGWHIQQNCLEKIKIPDFLNEFKTLIYGNFTPERFETKWLQVIEKYGIGEEKWIKQTYETRQMWATAFMREKFFAGIRTTSLCEGINSFIKRYVQCKNSILDFIYNFERAVEEYRHNELASDFKSSYGEPVLITALSHIEQGAAKLLTLNMFREVRHMIQRALNLNLVERSEIGTTVMIKFSICRHPNTQFLVIYDKNQNMFDCDCGFSEYVGIPCSHIICAMRTENMNEFPASLVSKRWLKTAKADSLQSIPAMEVDTDIMKMLRRGAISAACNFLSEYGADDSSDFSNVIEDIYKLVMKFQKRRHPNSAATNLFVIGDPAVVKTKGAPRKKKYKKTKRLCSNCRKGGHTIRTCPTLFEGNEVGESFADAEEDEDSSVEIDGDNTADTPVPSLGGDNGGTSSMSTIKAKRKVGDRRTQKDVKRNTGSSQAMVSPTIEQPQPDIEAPPMSFPSGFNLFPQFPASQILQSFHPFASYQQSPYGTQ
ncbi:protein FAR1-RELATED SEQUENCE 5-like [Lotus japonicus]|uniref:protein FAR1-RELATED SEQUENCE 5-like n=1 Tax=Lotus japonicus TaxID=34305 RepID=UPI002590DB46|nr:protein FAR1-RELATED SEQUENCE 5-like [Lotus japonicus]